MLYWWIIALVSGITSSVFLVWYFSKSRTKNFQKENDISSKKIHLKKELFKHFIIYLVLSSISAFFYSPTEDSNYFYSLVFFVNIFLLIVTPILVLAMFLYGIGFILLFFSEKAQEKTKKSIKTTTLLLFPHLFALSVTLILNMLFFPEFFVENVDVTTSDIPSSVPASETKVIGDFTVRYEGNKVWLTKYSGSSKVVTVPSVVTDIDVGVFYDVASLEELIIPNTVNHIELSAIFSNQSLKKITFPNSLDYWTWTLPATNLFQPLEVVIVQVQDNSGRFELWLDQQMKSGNLTVKFVKP